VGSVGDSSIRLAPPLILTKLQASFFLKAFEEVLFDMENADAASITKEPEVKA
jgi:4-aminobutyrate aminotransferase-like enzyme